MIRPLAWAAVSLPLAAAAGLPLFLDGPPPAHTGGFGERTCSTCHFDVPAADPRGGVVLSGLPAEGYSPGMRYLLRIAVHRPGLAGAGFQLSARDTTGAQAGVVSATDGRARVASQAGVAYAQHTRAGAIARDSAVWEVEWVAPPCGGGPVQFDLAANAADGDESALGDHIYTVRMRSAVAP